LGQIAATVMAASQYGGGWCVAAYKYAYFLVAVINARFDHIYPASARSAHAGIYRCEGCGREVIAPHGESLPGQDDHDHAPEHGTVRWRLIVATHG
jgi:hypothetical protein